MRGFYLGIPWKYQNNYLNLYMDFKENRVIYELGSFSFEELKSIVEERNEKYERKLTFHTSPRGSEMFGLLLNPTPENKLRLGEISKEIQKEAKESHVKNAELFIEKYGRVLYAFCEKISKKESFLAYKTGDYLCWDAIETGEVDEDDSFMVIFSKGEFSYIRDTCSGYGDRDILEKDIKKERVLQLLKK